MKEHSIKKVWRPYLIAVLLSTLSVLAGYIIAPIEVRYLQSLTNDSVLIGTTYGLGSIFFGLLSVWLGRVSDRVGRNKFIIFGAFVGVIYPLLYASTTNIFQYMGIKAGWAFSAVATGPIFMAYLQDLLKNTKDRAHYLSIVYSMQSVAGAIAMLIGGYLTESYGLIAPFFAMSVAFGFSLVVALTEFNIRDNHSSELEEQRHPLFGVQYIFKKPILRFYFVMNGVQSLNFGIKYMLYPLIIFQLTQSDLLTGSIMATQGIVAFCVLLFIGKIAQKVGILKSAFLTLVILAVSGNILGLTENINIFWIAAGFYALGEAFYGPVQAVLLTDYVDSKYRGEILGVDSAFDTVYNSLAPFIAGFFLVTMSAQNVLLLYTSLFWIALVINYYLSKKYAKHEGYDR